MPWAFGRTLSTTERFEPMLDYRPDCALVQGLRCRARAMPELCLAGATDHRSCLRE